VEKIREDIDMTVEAYANAVDGTSWLFHSITDASERGLQIGMLFEGGLDAFGTNWDPFCRLCKVLPPRTIYFHSLDRRLTRVANDECYMLQRSRCAGPGLIVADTR
jgi:hypothetical protein